MKLLMISGDRTLAAGRRGAFWYTLELLRTHFTRIDIICPRTKGGLSFPQPFPNVFLHPSPWGLMRQPLWILKRGKEIVRHQRPEVMTVHEYPPFFNGLGAFFLHRATRIPYALEIHHIVGSPVASSPSEWLGRLLTKLLLPLDVRPAKRVRTVNQSVRAALLQWGVPEEKVEVVPSLYLDMQLLQPYRDAPKKYDVAFCGRLATNKGLAGLIRALVRVPDATLLVIGDGPRRRESEKLAFQLGLRGRVTFAGWLPSQKQVVSALSSARMFVMNSRSEGGPRVALEAMACGLPVIATSVGVMPEVISNGENGLLIPMETRALADAITRLLSDTALRERMAHEAAKGLERFERKAAIENYARFLFSLAS